MTNPAAVVAENRLLGRPAPTAPDRVWVGYITYLPLVGGRWCYLATWRDACSRWVVGWHLAAQMPTELVLHALQQALTLRQPAPGLIVHADRGSQYTSTACRAHIAEGDTDVAQKGGALDAFDGRLAKQRTEFVIRELEKITQLHRKDLLDQFKRPAG